MAQLFWNLGVFPFFGTQCTFCLTSLFSKIIQTRLRLGSRRSNKEKPLETAGTRFFYRSDAIPGTQPTVSKHSSSSGGMLKEHSCFHDASPGRTIRCSPQCRMKSKVERFEIALDCLKPGLTRSASWAAPINRRRSVDACSAREWSSEAAARATCPNSLRRKCQNTEVHNFSSLNFTYDICSFNLTHWKLMWNWV